MSAVGATEFQRLLPPLRGSSKTTPCHGRRPWLQSDAAARLNKDAASPRDPPPQSTKEVNIPCSMVFLELGNSLTEEGIVADLKSPANSFTPSMTARNL